LSNQDICWAFEYLGKPYQIGAQGPDRFDCWGFFRYIQRERFGIDVPFIDADAGNFHEVARRFRDSDEREMWISVTSPKEGDAVLMAHCKYPSHVGVWLDVDGGGVLHCVRGEGVVFGSLTSLKNSGWGKVEYFRHASNA
jgi:cell wall-associated NlpC family hydrolase